ncbi:MAG TPA: 4-hydroxybenzoate octaprenyltransferase [Candidatus Acidoferrales bacterium]|nr:4-hydroxybenzoate octaprenyltransferase [Candidatus Acidoferrales bacterium]
MRKSEPSSSDVSMTTRVLHWRARWAVYAPTVRARLWQYALLMRWDRPIGALLLLWPMLWALWLAGNGRPDAGVVAVFVTGVWVMRSAGCVINDYLDRHVDPFVERTRDRPLAAGRVYPQEALALFGLLMAIALVLALLCNRMTLLLAFGGAFLAATYPLMKRYTYLPQVYLGMAFGWAVPMAWAGQTGQFPPPLAWLVFLTAVVWAVIYDTQYAMVDRDDDLKIGVKSTAILFGELDRPILAALQALMLLALVLIGRRADLAWPYFVSLIGVAALFVWQQFLMRARDRAGSFAAFRNNNWVGGVVFLGILASYLVS